MNEAQAYVVHYGGANQSYPNDATLMGYSEKNTWTLAVVDIPTLNDGEKIYFYVQAFNEKGVGKDDIEKAAYLNENSLGSAWSDAVVLAQTP